MQVDASYYRYTCRWHCLLFGLTTYVEDARRTYLVADVAQLKNRGRVASATPSTALWLGDMEQNAAKQEVIVHNRGKGQRRADASCIPVLRGTARESMQPRLFLRWLERGRGTTPVVADA